MERFLTVKGISESLDQYRMSTAVEYIELSVQWKNQKRCEKKEDTGKMEKELMS